MNKTIAFDLDEVIFDWIGRFLDWVTDNWDRLELDQKGVSRGMYGADARSITQWHFGDKWNFNRDLFMEVYTIFCEEGEMIRLPILSKYIPKNIGWIKGQGWRVIAVTSRPPRFIHDTWRAFRSNMLLFDALYHVGGHVGDESAAFYGFAHDEPKCSPSMWTTTDMSVKKDIFGLEQPSIVIDDNTGYIEDAAQCGVRFVNLMKRRHNLKWRTNHPNMNHGYVGDTRVDFVGPKWQSAFKRIQQQIETINYMEIVK